MNSGPVKLTWGPASRGCPRTFVEFTAKPGTSNAEGAPDVPPGDPPPNPPTPPTPTGPPTPIGPPPNGRPPPPGLPPFVRSPTGFSPLLPASGLEACVIPGPATLV